MKEARHQGYLVFGFIYVKFYKRQNYTDSKQIRGCQESGVGKWGLNTERPEGTFGEMEIFRIAIAIMVHNCTYWSNPLNCLVKTHKLHCI